MRIDSCRWVKKFWIFSSFFHFHFTQMVINIDFIISIFFFFYVISATAIIIAKKGRNVIINKKNSMKVFFLFSIRPKTKKKKKEEKRNSNEEITQSSNIHFNTFLYNFRSKEHFCKTPAIVCFFQTSSRPCFARKR